jgi:beta-mannosidase
MLKPLLFLFTALIISCQIPVQNSKIVELNKGWQFIHNENEKHYPASVPGSIHTDLLSNTLIDDPFFGCNENDLQWIEERDWHYFSYFNVKSDLLKFKNISIVFEGLDTYADVFLNDSMIISADNMFRSWEADCADILRIGKNRIDVKFRSASMEGKKKATALSYTLPEKERVFVRKAQYQFGWDWGPRFVGCGIWKPVFLRAWNDFDVDDLHFITNNIVDSLAEMSLQFSMLSEVNAEIDVMIADRKTGLKYVNSRQKVISGNNSFLIDFTIDDPELWWTHDLGNPHLYDLDVIFYHNGAPFFKENKKIGLRTIELVNEDDEYGKSFYFRLNGFPVYAKGANYIPQDNFPARVTERHYHDLLQIAVESNFNMLRVWGGGIYENDIFYELCDSLGILVWQDFMFACAMYPGDKEFLANVREEVTQQVRRLRNHPSIALWCGNNEIAEGWHNWGWQREFNYSAEDSITIWNDYIELFHNLIPEILSNEDTSRNYWPSSPQYGWGHDISLTHGDSHYWGVWWGMEPFEKYIEKTGRFASEYGFQGFPELSTLKKIASEKDLYLYSDALKCHQKHPRGYETIHEYMQREWPVTDRLEDYIYISQLVQAYGIKTAIEAHRNAKPMNMGTLYWQFNDCWPVVSWSGIDYYNNLKALHYFVRKAYQPYLITISTENDILYANVLRDLPGSEELDIEAILYDFHGNIKDKKQMVINISSVEKINLSDILPVINRTIGDKTTSELINVKLKNNGQLLSENISYANTPVKLDLKDPEIEWKIEKKGDEQLLTMKCRYLAKNVYISFTTSEGNQIPLSDNFFDMIPGREYVIIIKSREAADYLIENIRIKTLYDNYMWK